MWCLNKRRDRERESLAERVDHGFPFIIVVRHRLPAQRSSRIICFWPRSNAASSCRKRYSQNPDIERCTTQYSHEQTHSILGEKFRLSCCRQLTFFHAFAVSLLDRLLCRCLVLLACLFACVLCLQMAGLSLVFVGLPMA